MDLVITVESVNWSFWVDLVSGKVVITDEMKAWLVHVGIVWKSLSLQKLWESVASIIWVVDLADFHGVVRQVVVHDEWKIL